MEVSTKRFSKIHCWLLASLLIGLWLWLCWPMMSGRVVCGFRDSAFWYYPLFQWIDAQWAAGEVPLWNPFCNFGVPLVADGSSSVLYPGKLIFCLRFLSFPARYGLYLALHLLLAGAGAFWFSRILKANHAGASLAAVSYAMGGAVLFQVANVIYLVSAAWLPFALGCVWLMTQTGRWRWVVAAGAVCALMILGGDPQMVYHVGLIAAATGASRLWRFQRREVKAPTETNLGKGEVEAPAETNRRKAFRQEPQPPKPSYGLRHLFFGLVLLVTTTVVLSLVQLWPSIEWSKLSERTSPNMAVNVYNVIGKDAGESAASLFGPPEPGTIIHHAYQFSLPPWSLTELFWPNVSGKLYPVHQRWTDGLRGVDRIWIPSLYAGLLTVWLAIAGMKITGRSRRAWLTRVGLFFCVASFGWYGIAWWLNEVLSIDPATQIIGPQVGGLYWAMSLLLPKYYSFRYPAKLIVVAMLCLCVLAGVNLRTWRLKFSQTWILFFGAASVMAIASLLLGLHNPFFAKVPDDGLFGPFDDAGTTRNLIFGFLHSLIVLGTAVMICRWGTRKEQGKGCANLAVWCIVLITSVDLMIANRWLLAELPSHAFSESIDAVEQLNRQIAARAGATSGNAPPTLYRPGGAAFIPKQWKLETSPHRGEEIVQWQRETVFLQFHLQHEIRMIGSASSIWPEQYQRLLAHIGRDKRLLQELCDGRVVASNAAQKTNAPAENADEIEIAWFDQPQPIVFLMDNPSTAPENDPPEHDPTGNQKRKFPQPSTSGSCSLNDFRINEVRVTVETNPQPHNPWVVMNQLHDGNWIANITNLKTGDQRTQPLTELTDCFQGVQVEPGRYKITFQYYPLKFWIGAWISGLGWLGVMVGLGWAGCE